MSAILILKMAACKLTGMTYFWYKWKHYLGIHIHVLRCKKWSGVQLKIFYVSAILIFKMVDIFIQTISIFVQLPMPVF